MTEWSQNEDGTEFKAKYLGNDLLIKKLPVDQKGFQPWEWHLNGKKMEVATSGPDVEWQQKQMMKNVKSQITGWAE